MSEGRNRLMPNIARVAEEIVRVRQRYLGTMSRLQQAHGMAFVQRALTLARQLELKASLSISGAKRKQHDALCEVREEHTVDDEEGSGDATGA
jgi:hypothetical protein